MVRSADPARNWYAIAPQGPVVIEIDPVLRLSSMVMIRDAVRAGTGAARLPLTIALADIASGRMTYWGDVSGSNISL